MSQQELCPETETTCYSPFTAVCKSLALHRVDGWMGRQKMPKIDTLDALEEHEEHEDDYQTNSN